MSDYLLKIYQARATVFSLKELVLLFPDIEYVDLKNRLFYAMKTGALTSPRKGFYAKPNYNIFELANKVFTPSYISLQTVLREEGLIFQQSSAVFCVSYLSRKILVGQNEIIYKRLPEFIVNNQKGLLNMQTYYIASKERAFLDSLYVYKEFFIDNINNLDWNLVHEIKDIYRSKTLNRRVDKFYEEYYESSNI